MTGFLERSVDMIVDKIDVDQVARRIDVDDLVSVCAMFCREIVSVDHAIRNDSCTWPINLSLGKPY